MRFTARLSAALFTVAAACAIASCADDGEDGKDAVEAEPEPTGLTISRIGRFQHTDAGGLAAFDQGAAEIPAYDAASRRLFMVNAVRGGIDVLSITDPTTPTLVQFVDVGALVEAAAGLAAGTLGAVNSVSIRGGTCAVAIEAADKQAPGRVAFVRCRDLTLLGSAVVGALPDMVVFTADGSRVLVANEGEPAADYVTNPPGTVSIVSIAGGFTAPVVTTADFTAWNAGGSRVGEVSGLLAAGLRAGTVTGVAATFAEDMEPEYITVSDGTAYVTMQENNAIAVIDIATASVTEIRPLGFKDHGIPGNEIDASDRDLDGSTGAVNIRAWPGVVGAYMPDGIAGFTVNSRTYLITANEGDSRDYGSAAFEDEASAASFAPFTGRLAGLEGNASLGRLTVLKDLSTSSRLVAFGARSFTIWDASDGGRLFDSGSDFERITANRYPTRFNANSTGNALDNRSDNKGPEPEGVAVGVIAGRTYAFVGLERIGGIMAYDVSSPQDARFVAYENPRDFSATPGAGAGGDLAPEGMLVIPAADSPNGRDLLVVGNETSGTTAVYELLPITPVDGNG